MMRLIGTCLSALICIVCNGQYYYYNNRYYDKDIITEFGVSAGAMNCVTDLGSKAVNIKNFRAATGFYAGLLYRDVIGARLDATWGRVSAADKGTDNLYAKYRNLSFESAITEVLLLAEFHPLNIKYRPEGAPLFSPYFLIGAGNFSFNPQTTLGGYKVSLQPLHTEGQGFAETGRPDYKLSQFCLPAGGGIKCNLSPLVTLRGEAIYRVLNTDYLDDVSTTYIDPALFNKYLSVADAALAAKLYYRGGELQLDAPAPRQGTRRGSPKKDAYYSVNIKLGIMLGRVARRRF